MELSTRTLFSVFPNGSQLSDLVNFLEAHVIYELTTKSAKRQTSYVCEPRTALLNKPVWVSTRTSCYHCELSTIFQEPVDMLSWNWACPVHDDIRLGITPNASSLNEDIHKVTIKCSQITIAYLPLSKYFQKRLETFQSNILIPGGRSEFCKILRFRCD